MQNAIKVILLFSAKLFVYPVDEIRSTIALYIWRETYFKNPILCSISAYNLFSTWYL